MQEQWTRPVTAADFHRLADLAHARGLRVFELGSHRWFCTSHSDPFALHTVTGLSCDCRGFQEHQRCTHYALLLDRLGWLPEVEPDMPYVAASAVDCRDCSGCGIQTYRTFEERCPKCGGSGIRPNHHLHDVPAVPMVATAA